MRTADRMLAREWLLPPDNGPAAEFMEFARNVLAESPVLVADNVQAYVDAAETAMTLEGYPSLAPPWPSFWVEYPSSTHRQRRGVLVLDLTDVDARSALGDMAAAAREHAATSPGVTENDVRWVIALQVFVDEPRRGIFGPLAVLVLALGQQGQVLGNRWSYTPALAFPDVSAGSALPSVEELDAMPLAERRLMYADLLRRRSEAASSADAIGSILDAAAADSVDEPAHESVWAGDSSVLRDRLAELEAIDGGKLVWLLRATRAALQSIAFLHCHNVQTSNVSAPAKVQAKRRRRGRLPLIDYQTIRLQVPRRRGDSRASDGAESDERALHIVPGHFAHYGACCASHEPRGLLFGKLTAVVWMPTHARGSARLGRVRTDYDLRLPESVTPGV